MVSHSRRHLANAIRALSMDAVQKANSGHPGCPMGMADIAEVLWNDFLSHNPKDPNWLNRDRFVLSNGHGSMLLYALLHLTGYEDMTIEEIKKFRQLHSKTPGHPEYGYAPGIETTTGPLGQGFANAVGMALAERTLAHTFNRPGLPVVDHYTYAFMGDGCLMEGISHEAASLAGTLGLGKLIAFWDDNEISIDGPVAPWFGDNTPMRFEAYGWHVISGVDGHDGDAVKAAIEKARAQTEKPTLICCRTTIGFGAPNLQGKEKSHGAPLGDAEITLTREALAWEHAPFEISDSVQKAWDATSRGQAAQEAWQTLFEQYRQKHPELAVELTRRQMQMLPEDWQAQAEALLGNTQQAAQDMATRKASKMVLDQIHGNLPELFGGSADLTGSNLTAWSGAVPVTHDQPKGDYLHYGVREFGMAAIMNGMALYGGFIPFGGTFLTFVDYARNALRMAAIMKQRSIFVFTHDSIGLGEDGPTHQPIEQLTMLRATPNMHTWRPCDTTETVAAWTSAIEHQTGPTCLILTRQTVPHQTRNAKTLANVARGGYVLHRSKETPQVLLLATGSEVSLCMEAATQLEAKGVAVQVVSLPCWEIFLAQDAAYQEQVLPKAITARVAVEAGATLCWHKFVGPEGRILGIDRYGESAKASDLFNYFGFTVDNVVKTAHSVLSKASTLSPA